MKTKQIFMTTRRVKDHPFSTDKLVQKIKETVFEDCRLTVDEVSAMFPQLFRSYLHEIIIEMLGPNTIDMATQNESGR